MLAPANYYFLHQELRFFVCLQPVKVLHSAPLKLEKLSVLSMDKLYDADSVSKLPQNNCWQSCTEFLGSIYAYICIQLQEKVCEPFGITWISA